MSYTRNTWVNDTSPYLNATDLNNFEVGILSQGGATINATAYLAVGDGSTDDTTALQNWINAVVTARGEGILPAGTYKITSALTIPQGYGWKLRGVGPEASIIRQHTNNTPIFDVGASGSASVHSWEISDLQFTYNASQSSSQTNAICIKFSAMAYEGRILRCNFKYGFRGISVASGIVGVWGTTFDDLWFDSGITGSAISYADAAVNGVPNNHFGRMLISADNMVGPYLWLHGDTCKIDTIEVLSANQGGRVLHIASGNDWGIGQIKLETGAYATDTSLVYLDVNASARIGYLRIADITASSAAVVTLVNTQAQSGTDTPPSTYIRKLVGKATFGGTSKGYGVSAASQVIIDEVHLYKQGGASAGTWRLQDGSGSDSADQIQVLGHNRQRVSADLGNADYTITHGVAGSIPSPNILFFETTLGAQRDVNLPANIDDLWNGLTYTIVARNGAINGANTLRIRCSTTTLRTQSTDNYALTYTYRRQSSGTVTSNWKLTGVANLA